MKLINFSVTNYRSITAAHKIAFSDVTVLVGKNNEGKSNLLRALQAAMLSLQNHAENARHQTLLTSRGENKYSWKRDFPIQLQQRKSATSTIFKLEFNLDDNEISDFKLAIGSNLNGLLPLEIKIGKTDEAQLRVVKRGKGTKTLSARSAAIAKFVASRIHFNYIPAIRTDSSSIDLIGNMLSQELRILERDPKYIQALETISALQEPVLIQLAQRVQGPLKEFLPSIQSVRIEISEASRRYALRRDVNVIVDDGTPTSIEHKGDGVKSLAALGLLKNESRKDGASLLAIEEPESHLHPSAIHQINEIIRSISKTSQVILTTHNPLFVDRENIKSNILVADGSATPAKNIAAIRDLLGIKASDNLTNANYALVVEGREDVTSLKGLLPVLSEKIGKAIKNNLLVIEPIGGAGNLSYKLSLLRNSLCATHTLLDGDDAGRKGYSKALSDQNILLPNCTFVTCNGMVDAEFEDCLDPSVYKDAILALSGVDITSTKFRGNEKWSTRLKKVYLDQGKLWTDESLISAKTAVANAVARNPREALNQHKRNSIDALVVALERMIKV
jgi:putative ATP-dependent endonuclease of the OLD family